MNLQKTVLLSTLALSLVVLNGLIIQKELVRISGKSIFLELAPVDPRSLMQGDYMVLSYKITREIERYYYERMGMKKTNFIHLVLALDNRNVASFVRIYSSSGALKSNEILFQCRLQNDKIVLGAESFFFQEGFGEFYQNAKFAEIKVHSSGESTLVDLKGPNLETLVHPKK